MSKYLPNPVTNEGIKMKYEDMVNELKKCAREYNLNKPPEYKSIKEEESKD